MEFSNHREDHPTNSSEEVDQAEQENSDVGMGRSYECMFCKRGFTTAQALGGHMNIHRKDRAKSGPNSSKNSCKQFQEEYYAGPRFYKPIFSACPPRYFTAHEAQIHYRTYFPSTSSARPVYENHHSNNSRNDQDPHRVITSPSREELRMSLSLQFGRSYGEDDHMDLKKSIRGGSEEDGLDLELRLGHDP